MSENQDDKSVERQPNNEPMPKNDMDVQSPYIHDVEPSGQA